MSKFLVPQVEDNSEGWGPLTGPSHLKNIPYAPFGKADSIGKAADWTQQNYQKSYDKGRFHPQENVVFNFASNEDMESFRLVDTKVKTNNYANKKNKNNPARNARNQDNRNMNYDNRGKQRNNQQYYHQNQNYQKKNNWNQNAYNRRENQKTVVYSSSIEIRPEWPLLTQLDFSSMTKLSLKVNEPEDLYLCGEVEYYDKTYDRVTPKNEKPIIKTRRVFRNVTTSDDPIMRKLASDDRGKIFMTDAILTTLMCATRSVYSWDIFVTKVGDKLFFDKRDKGPLSYVTVNETAPEQIPEEKDNINGVQQLSLEATMIKQNFSQQVLRRGAIHKFSNPNPFRDGQSELASCAYRYRRWKLGPNNDYDIIVRCEIDSVSDEIGKPSFVSLKALNEFNPRQNAGLDWRKRLETQRGAVFATEIKNNMNKIAKWTAGAICAGIDIMKIGFVSRVLLKDPHRHTILGIQLCYPKQFAEQINLKMESCWGVLKYLIDHCIDKPDGKYVYVKDPNKQSLRLYDVSTDTFDEQYEDIQR